MASVVSSGHTRKRPFQPSITAFFNRDDNPNRNRTITSPLSPPLPAETQASLLSVGMRVRKSVPEGYKTHKTLRPQSFPFPSTAPPTTITARQTQSNHSSQPARELTPFCGLHKVGGMAEQPEYLVPPSSAPAAFSTDDFDDALQMPAFSLSQDTIYSTQDSFMSTSSQMTSKKRAYEDEIEDDLDAYFNTVEAIEQADRPIAKPRAMLHKPTTLDRFVFASGPDDFEEAAFLAPVEGMDLDQGDM
ncbi:Hypothetical protein R9X50_00634000 [Acrodontium crateriforme]|uniref:Uncharacterized protein n=1 Tax=Acrodontium crateriforme TaxID=150365 RepID=A0AAQ3M8Y8_9PEZI|nr:Hypothetical protein R9X50_00634000 [Acrodontium crateriforme]